MGNSAEQHENYEAQWMKLIQQRMFWGIREFTLVANQDPELRLEQNEDKTTNKWKGVR